MPIYATKIELKLHYIDTTWKWQHTAKPPVSNKSDFKVPNKYVRSSENHSANNTYMSTSNRYQELSKNDDIENESNTADYVKPTKAADSNKTN